MHIPDGYLSPQTYIPLFGAAAPFWIISLRKIKKTVKENYIPYLAMSAVFSFLIMMFNVPIPGGASGHATGAGLIAILFGPWAAILSVSIVLIVQAFIFGDGGITSIGANCFNMAVVMPFVSIIIFKLVNGKTYSGWRFKLGAFLAGYFGILAAAMITAIQLGIQPVIAKSPEGLPLYAPYPLEIALPVMVIEHLFLFGIVEGLITMIVLSYFYKHEPDTIHALKN